MPIFVIHEHHARNLHWDLRLESGGVLRSWALPKQPPRSKGIKRLAIQVEDHAKSYADFEGEIKEGYGKGKVKIWDKGNYTYESKSPKKFVFNLQGKVLKGKYCLIKPEFKDNKGKKKDGQWLFFRIQ
jgi:DNA ligase D-like protein (predicted 3'-phosphoesterase)|tara:strand:- start:2350 stop:2733 length:384 start_codon:yes stop_codon:yes gene_type:complete